MLNETSFGYVALIGLPNAGKSTLMNTLINKKLSIVTAKVQTTRRRILGLRMLENAQIAFLDTPGIFNPSNRLGKAMVNVALQAVQEADIICVLIDASHRSHEYKKLFQIAQQAHRPIAILLNKVDKTPKAKLLDLANVLRNEYNEHNIFMISALNGEGTEDVLNFICKHLPKGPWLFEDDDITDLSLQDIAAEFTREKLFTLLHQEIPYGLMVQHELWENDESGKLNIYQRIVVEKDSHKGIVLGKHGQLIHKIRTQSEKDIRHLVKKRVKLHLHVVIKEDWQNKPQFFEDQGLEFK